MNLYAILGGIALLVALVFGVSKWEKNIEARGYDKAAAIYAVAALKDEERQRGIEQQRNVDKDRIVKESHEREQATAAANDRLTANLRVLREREAAYRASRPTSSDPAVISERKAADAYADTFADCRGKYQEMGRNAQTYRNAGLACESQYESLSIKDKVKALK